CMVCSKGKRVSFATEEALARAPIEVEKTEIGAETVIVLEGVALERLEQRMQRFACGFSIRVVFNGRELGRPYATGCLPFVETDIGLVHLGGLEDGKATTSHLVFLQGFVVIGNERYASGDNIIHLDPSKFLARLPDRDKLIDQEEQEKRIDACLRESWRARLLREKASMGAVEFVERWFDAAATWRLLEIFDDVPALPGCLFRRISEYPIREGYRNTDHLERFQRTLLKEDIEAGRIKLVELDSVHDETLPHWMYARERGLTVFNSARLGDRHWVHPYVRALGDEECHVEVIGETVRESLNGSLVCSQVAICEAYALCVGEDRVVIHDEAMYWHEEDVILVPENECSGEAVCQVSNYIDSNDRWHYEDKQADEEALRNLIQLLRAKDPKQALGSLLADLKLEKYPSLRGKVFTLKVGPSPDRHEIELLE
ncbi:MAG TPA: ATP-binding protein, partial [Blastocatellia bacterium]|nr:ATP-binding protein [Blastocatellia bacterium]